MLTVFIATYNRGQVLSKTLKAMTCLIPPPGGWKLVVIDNGSSDGTRNLVNSYSNSLPIFYKFEAVLGKNAALNTGLSELEGDLAVFTDDDIDPKTDWLVKLRSAADAHSDFAMFGGVVRPKWEEDPPDWLKRIPQAPLLSTTDPNLQQGPTDPGNLFGPNLAIRSELFSYGLRFDETIGPRGTSYPMGSETELLLRLQKQDQRAWHVNDAVVEHRVRPEQITKRWILGRAIRLGRGQYRLHERNQRSRTVLVISVLPRLARRLVRIAAAWLTNNEADSVLAWWEFNVNWGLLTESFQTNHRNLGVIGEPLPARQNGD